MGMRLLDYQKWCEVRQSHNNEEGDGLAKQKGGRPNSHLLTFKCKHAKNRSVKLSLPIETLKQGIGNKLKY